VKQVTEVKQLKNAIPEYVELLKPKRVNEVSEVNDQRKVNEMNKVNESEQSEHMMQPPRLEIVDGKFGTLRIDEEELHAGLLLALDQTGNTVLECPADDSLCRLLTKRMTKQEYSDKSIEIYNDLLKLAGLSPNGRKHCKKAKLILQYREK